MAVSSITPSPQYRYLEPFKMRAFQYDSPHSNLLLSHYANNMLHIAGNDIVVRGLDIVPKIFDDRRGVNFEISAGDVIHDLTYIQVRENIILTFDNLNSYSGDDYYVILYTNYRYVEAVYENDLSIECTLYNIHTKSTLTPWDSSRYRIILGAFKFTTENGEIKNIGNVDVNGILITDQTTIFNGDFTNTVLPWHPIDGKLTLSSTNYYTPPSCLEVLRTGGSQQGAFQVFKTELDKTYRIVGYVTQGKSSASIPWTVTVSDGDYTINKNLFEYESKSGYTTSQWQEFTLTFTAVSKQATIFLLKTDTTPGTILWDNIHCFNYKTVKPLPDTSSVKKVDGGLYIRP